MIVDYKSDLRSLARSIVIKSSHQAYIINDNIIDTYGSKYVDKDYTTWRYYLNLNGVYHFTNTQEISVFITDINEIGLLTKENMELYPKTRNELAKYGRTYLSLVKKYPSDETLIKGIISPIDMEVAKNAKDGAILSYSDVMSEESDIETIKKLSRYTESIYYRWFNHHYLELDKHYLSTFLMFLHSTLETKIDLIRLDNVHTHNVHSYHLEQFFKSNMDIDTTYMNRRSKLWLYQNLRAVISNTGKSETLTELVDNVLTPNGIGIGRLNILKSPVRHRASVDYLTPTYDTKNNRLIVSPINKFYTKSEMSVAELTTLEVESDYIHSTQFMDLGELVDDIQSSVDKNTDLTLNTKVLHITKDDDRDILPFPRVNMVLDNLFFLAQKTEVNYTISIMDDNTDRPYMLTYNQAIRLLAFLLLKSIDEESDVVYIESKSIVNIKNIDINSILIPDDSDYKYLESLDYLRPIMEDRYSDPDDIVEYIEQGIDYFTMDWVLKSSMINYVSVANLEILDRTIHGDTIEIAINNIDSEINLELTDEYDYFNTIRILVSAITNDKVSMDIHDIVVDKLKTYANMMKKLISYNTQIIDSSRGSTINHLFDVGFGELVGEQVTKVNAYFNGLEDLDGNLNIGILPETVYNKIPNANYALMSELDYGYGMWINGKYSLPLAKFRLGHHDMSDVGSIVYSTDDVLKESQLQPMSGLLNYKATQIIADYTIGSISDYSDVDNMKYSTDDVLKESQLQPMSGLLNYKANMLRGEYYIEDVTNHSNVESRYSIDNEVLKESSLHPMSGLMNYKASQLRGEYHIVEKDEFVGVDTRYVIENELIKESSLHPMSGLLNYKTSLLRGEYLINDKSNHSDVDIRAFMDNEILNESQLQSMSGLLNYKASLLNSDYIMNDNGNHSEVDIKSSRDDELLLESSLHPMSGLMNYKATQINSSYIMEEKNTYQNPVSILAPNDDALLNIKLTVKEGAMTERRTISSTSYRMSSKDILEVTHKEISDNQTLDKSRLTMSPGGVLETKSTLELE